MAIESGRAGPAPCPGTGTAVIAVATATATFSRMRGLRAKRAIDMVRFPQDSSGADIEP
jgi:hypothetical protein